MLMDELNDTAIEGDSSLANVMTSQVGERSSSYCLLAAAEMSLLMSNKLIFRNSLKLD